MEFDTVYIGVCSWCCEIAVSTKNYRLINWQVMFFKREKSMMENFYVPIINVLERKLLAFLSHWDPSIFIEWDIYIYIYVEGHVTELSPLHTQSV